MIAYGSISNKACCTTHTGFGLFYDQTSTSNNVQYIRSLFNSKVVRMIWMSHDYL